MCLFTSPLKKTYFVFKGQATGLKFMRHGEENFCCMAEHTNGSSEEAESDYDSDLSYFGTFAEASGSSERPREPSYSDLSAQLAMAPLGRAACWKS